MERGVAKMREAPFLAALSVSLHRILQWITEKL